jgi:SNF2-related domain/Helicase conserved C-terminal domain
VWLDWIERMFPGADPLCLAGKTIDVDAVRSASVIFAHYDIVAHHRLASLSPGTLIVDEAHLLSNARSRRSEAVQFFACSAKRVITLTGTPLWNSTKGLWPILATTNPGAWGPNNFDFNQRHCSPTVTEYGWAYGEISNSEEWLKRRAEVVFQADWKTERPDLTPTKRTFVEIPLTAAAIRDLDFAAESLRVTGSVENAIGTIGRYRQIAGLLKVDASVDAVFSVDGPAVLWAWHKQTVKTAAKVISKAGRPAFIVHGGTGESVDKRLKTIDKWRESVNGVLCATLAVGQVGIDLSHSRFAVMTEYDWTPAVMYQAEMRTFTPDRSMTVVYPRVGHPVETLLIDKILTKLSRAESSAMPAAGLGFDLRESNEDGNEDELLKALSAIVSKSDAIF